MKSKIDKTAIISMAGISLSLLSLIIIFSRDTVFSFLTTAIVRPFGFLGFWILLPFIFILGLYMLLKQKLVKFKIGLSLWGVLIIIFSLLILTSVWSEEALRQQGEITNELNFGTMSEYAKALEKFDNNPYDTTSGGGVIGYFLAACLFSAITKVGAQIVCWLLIVVGLCLVFNRLIKKLFVYLKGKKSPKAAASDNHLDYQSDIYETPMDDNNISQEPINVSQSFEEDDTPSLQELERRNFNNTHSLKKVEFSFSQDQDDGFAQSLSNSNGLVNPSFSDDNQFGLDEELRFSQSRTIEEPVAPATQNDTPYIEEVSPVDDSFEVEPPVQELEVEQKVQEPLKPQPAPEPEPVVDKLHRPQPKANPIKNYVYPPISLLDYHEQTGDADKNNKSTQETIDKINQIFQHFKVGAEVVGSTVGPTVTRYDVKTDSNVSVNTVARYVEDIAVRLGGVSTRFEKIVAGQPYSGLEIPNAVRTNVGLRESIEKLPNDPKSLRNIPFGKNISGELLQANLCDFPHMLVSGTTGSGKTIFMHSVILSLIMRNKPDEVKLILIDPKKVEMVYYEKIPHLLCPNISDSQQAYVAMKKLVDEMERRYNLFAANRVRDIKGFNQFAKENGIQPLPYIVVFVDEYADLVEEVKDIKTPVVRIAQKARAAGIHLVIATQRPSVNVIDGVIKANVAVRVALMVASQTDSITIINQAGAEALLGNGDMIVDCSLISRSVKPRVQGCFVDVPEINRVCDFLRSHYQEQYDPEFLDLEEKQETPDLDMNGSDIVVDKEMAEEQLYELIKESIVERDYCSISYIQRTYGVGFPKAGRLFNKLINDGYVARGGDARGSKVLIRSKQQEQQMGTIEQSTFVPDEGEES